MPWYNKTLLDKILLFTTFMYSYFVFAAAGMDGFYQKLHFREHDITGGSFVGLLEGTGARPYVYRRLVPRVAVAISDNIPESIKDVLTRKLTENSKNTPGETSRRMYTGVADNPKYAVTYYIIYIICFLSLYGGMLAMRAFCLSAGFRLPAASITPLLFVIFFPLIETLGAYYYDCTEILFIFTFLWLYSTRTGLALLIPLAVLATLNKETFLIYLICSIPLLFYLQFSRRRAVLIGFTLVASFLTHFLDMKQYAHNLGGNVEWWFLDNLKFYANPFNLLYGETVYRIPMPSGYNIFLLAAIVAAAWYGRSSYAPIMRLYFAFGGFVTVVLCLFFAYPGELRNLSLMYPALAIFIAAAIERALIDFNYSLLPLEKPSS